MLAPDVRHLACPPQRVRPMYIAGQPTGAPCHQQQVGKQSSNLAVVQDTSSFYSVAAASTMPGRRWEGVQPGSGRNSAHQ
eukprot:4083571-Amphidinium_carterae.1